MFCVANFDFLLTLILMSLFSKCCILQKAYFALMKIVSCHEMNVLCHVHAAQVKLIVFMYLCRLRNI